MDTKTTSNTQLPEMMLNDLKVGDVMLSRGKCDPGKRFCISDLIIKLDGGDYSHAAFFDGEHFVQATTNGVALSEPTILPDHQHYVHVYRFKNSKGEELGPPNLVTNELVNYARGLKDIPYGYEELLLIAMLVLSRKFSIRGLIGDILEVFAGATLAEFYRWLKRITGRGDTIVCSELVSEVFWNPSDKHGTPYGLPIEITKRHKLRGSSPEDLPDEKQLEELENLRRELEEALNQAEPGFSQLLSQHQQAQNAVLKSETNGKTLIAGSKLMPSMFVSPGDLQRSEILHCVGNYVQSSV